MRTADPSYTKAFSANERNKLIDSLRSYALMGLFLVHIVEYYELFWYSPQESIYKDVIFVLFGGKAYSIFALLFGVSFYLLFNRKKSDAANFTRLIVWRFCLLLVAGTLHSLIYGGDILQVLAIAGFLLIPLHRTSDYFLLLIASTLLLQLPPVLYASTHLTLINTSYNKPLHWELFSNLYKVYAHGSLSEVITANFLKEPVGKFYFMIESGRIFTIVGMSLLGYWLGKKDFFSESSDSFRKYALCLLLSLAVASIFYLETPHLRTWTHAEKFWIASAILNSYSDLSFTFVSIFTFALLYQMDVMKKIMNLFAPCGRMSLTLYVSQSLIFVPLFYGFGLGGYKFLGQANSFMIGVAGWIVQVIFAHYWFRNYYYGPLEWVWRAATYFNKSVRLRRERTVKIESIDQA